MRQFASGAQVRSMVVNLTPNATRAIDYNFPTDCRILARFLN